MLVADCNGSDLGWTDTSLHAGKAEVVTSPVVFASFYGFLTLYTLFNDDYVATCEFSVRNCICSWCINGFTVFYCCDFKIVCYLGDAFTVLLNAF